MFERLILTVREQVGRFSQSLYSQNQVCELVLHCIGLSSIVDILLDLEKLALNVLAVCNCATESLDPFHHRNAFEVLDYDLLLGCFSVWVLAYSTSI